MLLCAQYILPVSSEPIIDGAVLVRDGVIRDIGKAEQLRLRPRKRSSTRVWPPSCPAWLTCIRASSNRCCAAW